MRSGSFWKRVGVWTILAGLVIAVASRFVQRRNATEISGKILGRLSSREPPLTEEAGEVAQLFRTDSDTRAEFLSLALSSANVERLRANEQGLSVALSQVK